MATSILSATSAATAGSRPSPLKRADRQAQLEQVRLLDDEEPALEGQPAADDEVPLDSLRADHLHAKYAHLQEQGRHEEARAVADEILERKMERPRQFRAHASEALAHFAKGNSREGLMALREAQRVCDELLTLYEAAGDEKKAQAVRTELLSEALTEWQAGQDRALGDAARWLSQGLQAAAHLEARQHPWGTRREDFAQDLEILQKLADETPAPTAPGKLESKGAQYTSWGTNHSLGTLVDTGLHYATLSTPARALGNRIQGGRDSGVLYAVGAVIKGLASVTGGVSSIVAGFVAWGETIARNIAESTLRLAGAAAVGSAGLVAKAAGLVSDDAAASGDKMLARARDWAGNISFMTKGKLVPLPVSMMARASELAQLARFTGTTSADVRAKGPPSKFTLAAEADIPPSVLARKQRDAAGRGTVAKLRFDAQMGRLVGDRSSDLLIGVYREASTGKVVLSFVGTQGKRPATLKSNLAQGMGIEDSAYAEAKAVVEAFVKQYGAANVELIGHSLGGGLASYAGIANGVKVTGFNSAGLHPLLRNKLGADRINNADVSHINTVTDPISQRLESRRLGLTAGSQVGHRYVVPESKGHSLKDAILKLDVL